MKQISILKEWEIPNVISIKQATSGLLNQTFIVRTENAGIYILQKLHTAISIPGCTENYFHVTHYLKSVRKQLGQIVVPSKEGRLTIAKQELQGKKKIIEKWRLLEGIEGEVYTHTKNSNLAYEAGKLLSKFHTQVKDYRKPLSKTLPMFQYEEVLTKLKKHSKQLLNSGDMQIVEATELILEQLPKLLLPKNLPKQIIHTDPKISNFLFTKKHNGICMIDLDTIQNLSPLYDLGDALRSWAGTEEDDPNNRCNYKVYNNFVEGYLSNRKHPLSRKEKDLIPQACKLVTIGLAARFLNDYKEDNYFGWDKSRYKSRMAHNKARTLGQLSLYRSLVQEKVKN